MAIKTCIEHIKDELILDCAIRKQIFVSVQINAAGSINLYYKKQESGAVHVKTYKSASTLSNSL